MTTRDGGLSLAPEIGERPDAAVWLNHLATLDPDCFKPAAAAALRGEGGGKLAWEVSLPESCWIDGDAGLAVLIPAWNRRRGRLDVDFSRPVMRVTVGGGKQPALDGEIACQTTIDGSVRKPVSGWEELCQYTDDDVHYLELEQKLDGGAVLQRQLLTLRDDQAVLIGDSVLVPEVDSGAAAVGIEHVVRMPIGGQHVARDAAETREVFLRRDDRDQALVIPVGGGEWRVGSTNATLVANGEDLVWRSTGRQRMYSPLWIDLQRRRFDRPRTWRRLTVAEELKLVDSNVATAFRIQSGSSQWMFYRSLVPGRLRTVLGKHLMHDFYASRFDPGDGVHEDLVTVDDA